MGPGSGAPFLLTNPPKNANISLKFIFWIDGEGIMDLEGIMQGWDKFLEQFDLVWGTTFIGMTAGQLIAGMLILIVFLGIRKIFAKVVISRLRKFTQSTTTDIDDQVLNAVAEPLKFVPIIVGVFVFANYFEFNKEVEEFLFTVVRSLIAFVMFWGTFMILTPVSSILEKFLANMSRESEHLFAEEFTGLIIKSAKLMIIGVAIIIILSQWGINVLPLLTGLGIAGMAIAFAAKDSIENIFGGVKIIMSGIFKRGDWIQTPSVEGTVEEIGIATTNIRTFAKAMQSVPNSVLATEPITNWSKMSARRIKMMIGLEYRTQANAIENIIDKMREYLRDNPDIANPGEKKVVQMVHLVEFGGSSIDISLYYFTNTVNWMEWRRVKHENMLAFIAIVESEGASFAFPSQSVYVETMAGVEQPKVTKTRRKQPKLIEDGQDKTGGYADMDEGGDG